MFTWRRVIPEYYRPIMSAVLAAFGFGWLLLHIAGLLFGLASGKDVPVVWTLIGLMFLTLWTTAAFRVGRSGIFISDRGVRCRAVWTTKTFDWSDIRTFELRPLPVVPGMQWLKSTSAAGYIWVIPYEGEPHRTTVSYSVLNFFGPHTKNYAERTLAELHKAHRRYRQ